MIYDPIFIHFSQIEEEDIEQQIEDLKKEEKDSPKEEEDTKDEAKEETYWQ